MKITEKAWQGQIEQLCKLLGYDYYHTWRSIHSPAGFPDLVLVNPTKRRLVIAELKTGKTKLTLLQEKWIKYFQDCGVEAYVWRPEQLEEITYLLRR